MIYYKIFKFLQFCKCKHSLNVVPLAVDMFTLGQYFYNNSEWVNARDWLIESLHAFDEEHNRINNISIENTDNQNLNIFKENISLITILDYLAFTCYQVKLLLINFLFNCSLDNLL